MSVLLKHWRCVDCNTDILSELDYRVHTSTHPGHRIVWADEAKGA